MTTGIHPEAAFMLHGFGQENPSRNAGLRQGRGRRSCMISGLEHEDPLGGGLALQEHFITIRKAEETD